MPFFAQTSLSHFTYLPIIYRVSTEKVKKGKRQNEKSMEQFSKELKETSKQQLGRKRSRLGLPRTRKKLDATLQGMYCKIFYQLEIFKTLQEGFEFPAYSI